MQITLSILLMVSLLIALALVLVLLRAEMVSSPEPYCPLHTPLHHSKYVNGPEVIITRRHRAVLVVRAVYLPVYPVPICSTFMTTMTMTITTIPIPTATIITTRHLHHLPHPHGRAKAIITIKTTLQPKATLRKTVRQWW